jgi:hypothetical protein
MKPSPITKEKILEKETELLKAIESRDIDKLEHLLHEELLFILPGGETITKKMDLDSHRAGEMVVEKLKTSYEKLNIIEDTAIVTLSIETQGKMLGKDFQGKFRYIRMWKQIDEELKVIGGSCTRIS